MSDLCQLQYLAENNVLYNLKYRYNQGDISTSTTPKVLIVVNPYEAVPGIESTEFMEKYRSLPMDMEGFLDSKETGPNTYMVAHSAYSKLCLDANNQSCIVCGESGAGKTESAKLIMRFLAYASSANFKDAENLFKAAELVGKQVLDANPILESFGNAKTLLNDNSSRFGKFTKMLFDQEVGAPKDKRMLVGAEIETYLLEKSRIVRQNKGERNYHAFYYMTTDKAKSLWPEFKMTRSEDYHYTNQSGCYTKKHGKRQP